MKLVNETDQEVFYSISGGGSADCGNIEVDGLVDLPYYDNQQNVIVAFSPVTGTAFTINCETTGQGEQVEMALIADSGEASE
ncbi:MAG TPA: hypothetical protein VGN86_07205 [Pyrinomonadaceae bacterium]|nr:hypothetical protein [Pyrinomonadaceae bacterium]